MPQLSGGILGDIFGTVSDGLDAINSIVKKVPGASWLEGAVSDGAGWIGDIAKTPKGQFIIFAITNAFLFPAAAGLSIPSASGMQTLGPQLASAVWAIPGMAAGDSFTEAYTKELTWRSLKLAEYLGANALAEDLTNDLKTLLNDPEVQKSLAEIKNQFAGSIQSTLGGADDEAIRKTLTDQGLDPPGLSNSKNVRQDAAAAMLNGIFRRHLYDLNDFPIQSVTSDVRPGNTLSDLLKNQKIPVGSFSVMPAQPSANGHSFFHQVFVGALLTSPFWLPIAWPKLKPYFHLRRFHR